MAFLSFTTKRPKKSYRTVELLFNAKRYLDNARMIIKQMIEPEHNSHVMPYIKAYAYMSENLGRMDKRIDEAESAMLKLNYSSYLSKPKISMNDPRQEIPIGATLAINLFKREIETAMTQLVINPFIMAYRKFMESDIERDGKKIIKDYHLFGYFIFWYLYHASLTLGIWTREPKSKVSESPNTPPEIPENAKWAEKEQETDHINSQALDDKLNSMFGGQNARENTESNI